MDMGIKNLGKNAICIRRRGGLNQWILIRALKYVVLGQFGQAFYVLISKL